MSREDVAALHARIAQLEAERDEALAKVDELQDRIAAAARVLLGLYPGEDIR